MKTLQLLFLAFISTLVINQNAFAQSNKVETFDVSGNCGMCKSNIEKAAKAAGASFAEWNMDSKKITIKFASNTSVEKIQQKIAEVGYDNAGVKASDEAYSKLHACCKYDRTTKAETKSSKSESCCN